MLNNQSSLIPVISEVPQGSVHGPTSFLLCTSLLYFFSERITVVCKVYADDI